MTSWLYDRDPFRPLKWQADLAAFKARLAAGEDVFAPLIRKFLLENKHRCAGRHLYMLVHIAFVFRSFTSLSFISQVPRCFWFSVLHHAQIKIAVATVNRRRSQSDIPLTLFPPSPFTALHCSVTVELRPDTALAAQMEAEEKGKLDAKRGSMSAKEIEELIETTRALKERQVRIIIMHEFGCYFEFLYIVICKFRFF